MQERLGIVGGGAIACGLAVAAAEHTEVILWSRSQEAAAERLERAAARLDPVFRERLTVVAELDELADRTFVVEAIAEDLEAKLELLAKLGSGALEGTVIASTTSSLPVAELAEASGRPDRFVALHVFNPVPKMPLVELCFHADARPETHARARAVCAVMGKTAVEVPDVPGFVVNRLLFPYLFSAVALMEETGLPPADVDTCMRLGAGHPMGPIALLDFVGLDVAAAIGDAIGTDVPEILRAKIADGKLGRKSGAGFYDY